MRAKFVSITRVVRVLDQPLPGDLVIRCREDSALRRVIDVWVITPWPSDDVIGGPYQSYTYALQQARGRIRDRSSRIWRDLARAGNPEKLELVSGGLG
jgi:hypothetical protein